MIYIAVFLSRDISWITNISVVCYQQTLSTSLQCPTTTDGRGSDAETSATTASSSVQRKPTTDAELSSAVARRSADIRLVRIVKRWLRKRTGKSTSPQRGRQGMISESSEGRSACCLLGEITRRSKSTTDCTSLCCGYRCMWSQGSCSSRRLRSSPGDVVAHQRCPTACCPADSDDDRGMSCKSYRTTVGRRRTTGEHSNLIYSCCCSRRRAKQRQSSGKRHSDSDADDDELRRLTESEQHSSSTAEVSCLQHQHKWPLRQHECSFYPACTERRCMLQGESESSCQCNVICRQRVPDTEGPAVMSSKTNKRSARITQKVMRSFPPSVALFAGGEEKQLSLPLTSVMRPDRKDCDGPPPNRVAPLS